MKNLLAILTLLFALQANISAQTPIGGVISSNTTLTLSSSPYVVTSNILVTNGTTLTIDPGVEVRFLDSLYMQIEGTIRAIGTAQNRILFQLDPSGNYAWGGIRIMNASVDYDSLTGNGCVISYANFTETAPVPVNIVFSTSLIHCILSSPLLDHLDISCCSSGLFFDQSSAILSNSVIHDNMYLTVYVNPYYPPVLNQKVIIRNNHFYNNSFPSNQGSILIDLLGAAEVDGNCIDMNTADMLIRMRVNNTQITNNRISNTYGVAIGLMGGTDSTQVITGNEFTNNRIHFVFPSCVRYPIITGNNINSFMQMAAVCTTYYYPFLTDDCPTTSNSSFVYNMQGNYWGNLTTPTLIAGAIQDFDDNFQHLIDIDYTNPLTSPAPIASPPACNNIGLNCATLGAPATNAEHEISLWPSPLSGSDLHVSLLKTDYYSYSIFSTDGRCVAQADFANPANSFVINTTDLSSGCYFLAITGRSGTITRKTFLVSR